MSYRSELLTQVTQYRLVNTYLVREDDGLTLVDAAIKGFDGAILKAAKALGQPIRRVVLTHAHVDHVGALNALLGRLPDAEFIVGRRESAFLGGKFEALPDEPQDGKLRDQPFRIERTPDRLIDEGDRVGSLEVFFTPGHSPGHVTFLDTRTRAAIVGDVYSTVGGVATTAGPYLRFPLPGFFSWHRPTELASAQKVRDLGPTLIAPGHGPVVEQPIAKMDKAIRRSS